MQNELLFEIGTEEIPAGYLLPALNHLQQALGGKLQALNLPYREISGAATPRRLTACVSGLAERQPDRREEILGPPKKAAFTPNNQPTKAAEGFAKSQGVDVEELQVVATPKGEYVMAVTEKKGQPTSALLCDLLPELIEEIPFPKSMRWGSGRVHFARPIQWLLALYDGRPIPFQLDTLTSGDMTTGHRFMGTGFFKVQSFAQYSSALREAHVLVDPQQRRAEVVRAITAAAESVGGRILPDDELIDTVMNLVEWPHAVCGTFDRRFLTLPREVLITSMREHQKYFAVVDEAGELMPHFIAVNNTAVKDQKLAAEGHQRVLRARLEDAFFFFKEDQGRPLADRVVELSGVIFQAKLGTLLEKTERLTMLAGHLAQDIAPDQLATVQRAAHLAKADLLTDMVNEFPSLQGLIGRDYALRSGEAEDVAAAIYEHYLPARAGGELPQGTAGAIVGIADRLDTIAGCFGIGQTPTGTTDPFGLRRLALGLLHIIAEKSLAVSLEKTSREALALYGDKLSVGRDEALRNIIEFIKGRFVNDLVSRGIPIEAVEAVTSVGFDDVMDCRLKIDALVAISARETFTLLAGAFKRVINIIKDNRDTRIDESLLTETAERDLYEAFQHTSDTVRPLLDQKAYGEALAAILRMKEPVDRFFDDVMVMVEDADIRRNRLALLTAIAQLFLLVGDFSKMYALHQ